MASLTVARIEDALIRRARPLMEAVGMAVVASGSNADLADPIATALRAAGIEPADPLTPADPDVAGMDGPTLAYALDRAERRVLETAWTRWPHVDMQQGDDSQKLSQLADRLRERIAFLDDQERTPTGLAVGRPARAAMRGGRVNDPAWCDPRGWPRR